VRTFGFVQFLDELKNLGQELKTQLEKEWAGFDIAELKKKPDILDELFKAGA